MLQKYMNADLVPLSTLDLAELIGAADAAASVYRAHGALEVPRDLAALLEAANKVMASRLRDELLARRSQAAARLEALQTPAEKRRQAEAELAELDKLLKP